MKSGPIRSADPNRRPGSVRSTFEPRPHAMRAVLFALALLVALPAQGQRAYDQASLAAILDRDADLPDRPVQYHRYRIEHESGNSILARHELYEILGEGNRDLGRARLGIAQLLGQPDVTTLRTGQSIVLPDRPRDFDLNPLAYAPYPRTWAGAAEIDRAVVVDLTTQTWAAYANGSIVRWGPVSTGKASTPTPTGRYLMNWRALERESSEAPPGETWLMRYVMNIYPARGIHLHQYNVVPSGPPEGHGCVRMVTSDARWLWGWTGGERTTPGTVVIVQGTTPTTTPVRFVDGPDGPERVMVELPAEPMSVPRGDR